MAGGEFYTKTKKTEGSLVQFIPAYFPSIKYMQALLQASIIEINLHAHYQKQTYRNRCQIYGANGTLNLTVPICHAKTKEHQKDKEVKIMWEQDWQKQHWKSLESAYRSSPYFEFYEDDLKNVFFQQPTYLMDYNTSLLDCLLEWLCLEIDTVLLDKYKEFSKDELLLIQAKKAPLVELPPYTQVFENKHGFIGNLSVLDLIFNLGPESNTYLENLS